jgi:hypothetical protein
MKPGEWLAQIVKGFFSALFGWGQDQAEKPKTTRDANTPKDVRDSLSGSVSDWMRDKDNGRR